MQNNLYILYIMHRYRSIQSPIPLDFSDHFLAKLIGHLRIQLPFETLNDAMKHAITITGGSVFKTLEIFVTEVAILEKRHVGVCGCVEFYHCILSSLGK